jgi:hypothetical protein
MLTGKLSRYFITMLVAFSSDPFFNKHVQLPHDHQPVPPKIRDNPKFFPFFKDTLGAIDGTHINCTTSAADRQAARDRKGTLTQNCLAICSFDMRFLYIFPGWDGSAADATMFYDARVTDLPIIKGKYYLADAGFPTCETLLIPYRGVRYHLAEWGRAQLRYVSVSHETIYLDFDTALPIKKSYLIYDTRLHEMLSNTFLGS